MASNAVKVFNDPVHGHIELSVVSVCILDTVTFARLRDLRQLGAVYEVFPGASHHRFEHSLGVGALAREYVNALADRHPEYCVTREERLCVEIAGLCHDLGHGILSHMFDHMFVQAMAPPGSPAASWRHEHGSVSLFRHICTLEPVRSRMLEAGLDDAHQHLICELILGHPSEAPAGWTWRGVHASKAFLFEIVANKVNGIDVDKLDYFQRDCKQLNMAIPFDAARLMKFARVVAVAMPDGSTRTTISYPAKEAWNVYSLFSSRYSLHKRAYQHKVARAIELMYCEALKLAEPFLTVAGRDGVPKRLCEAVFDPEAYSRISDYLLRMIACGTDPNLAQSRELLHRISRRQLFRCVGESILPPARPPPGADIDVSQRSSLSAASAAASTARPAHATAAAAVGVAHVEGYDPRVLVRPPKVDAVSTKFDIAQFERELLDCAQQLADDHLLPAPHTIFTRADIITEVVKISWGMGALNPVDRVWFYHVDKLSGSVKVKPIARAQVSNLVPETFEESYIRVYARERHVEEQVRVTFGAWCERNHTSMPVAVSPILTQPSASASTSASVSAAAASPTPTQPLAMLTTPQHSNGYVCMDGSQPLTAPSTGKRRREDGFADDG